MTEQGLRELLESNGVACAPSMNGMIPMVIGSGTSKLFMTAAVNDGFVQFRTVQLLIATGASYRGVLLRALLHGCYRYKMVKFAFDESDGEVVAYIDVYLGEANLTKGQLQRCLNTARTVVLPMRTR